MMKHPPSARVRRSKGFALVVVLSVLALLLVLIVGLISRAGTERSAATGFQASVSARQLADTAVSLVQGQIYAATTQGTEVAWTSQPGMVRTFDKNGESRHSYKLYSSSEMISEGAPASGSLSADMPPATWGEDVATWSDLNAPLEVNGTKNFPILDPSSPAQGFAINSAPGANAFQLAPMPVRWLYVLKDGSLVAPTGTGATASVAETASNPIVGRVAFWTDDDTCKVNINTASEGVYWDTPRAGSQQELGFARFQPAQKEWQRYPGHPAMTSLSTALPALTPSQIYALAPRVAQGGSQGGTAIAGGAVNPDSDRLYASVDELIFDPNRSDNGGLDRQQVEQAKFFLTARSRAPETNLFNLPRIAAWPIYRMGSNGAPNTNRTTAFDRLIAFCSSTGKLGAGSYHPYIFQRELPSSSTNDINLARNQQLYSYLQYLTGEPVPGFGGNFSAKYGDDRNQILTQIFDYVRTTNLADGTLSAGNRFASNGTVLPSKFTVGVKTTQGLGRMWTVSEVALLFICNARADDLSTPLVDESAGSNDKDTNKALGDSSLASGERLVQAIIIPELFSPMQGWPAMAPTLRMRITGLGSLSLEGQTLFGSLDGETATIPANSSVYLNGLGGPVGWRMFGVTQVSPARGALAADSPASGQNVYPFISIPVKIAASGQTMLFAGGLIEVELYPGSGVISEDTLIQKIQIQLPSGDFPLPEIVSTGTTAGGSNDPVGTSKENWWAFSRTGAVDNNPGRLAFISQRPRGSDPDARAGDFFRDGFDTLRSIVPKHGDFRLIAANHAAPASLFTYHPKYISTSRVAHNLSASPISGGGQIDGRGAGYDTSGKYISSLTYPSSLAPDIPFNSPSLPETTGDFDTGLALSADGAFANKPDEGNINGLSAGNVPYFSQGWQFTESGPGFFSPNRQIPSPGMFGSLPSRVLAGEPWRTLLFRPQASHPADESNYTGDAKIQDHLLLDFFWMPVVEPYAISDRFSTAGKINMNFQILPFTYIERSTGIHALLNSEKVAAIPNSKISSYKPASISGTNASLVSSNPSFRLPIDADETLQQFRTKFSQGEVFRSASEICDIHIVPEGETSSSMQTFWQSHALTGENLREKIYTTLYPRLTTKSNTYTVHFRAQALRKMPDSTVGTWSEGKDQVLGEYRGSTTIERFIDANNTSIPDYAANPTQIPSLDSLDKFYRWRVIENRQFAP